MLSIRIKESRIERSHIALVFVHLFLCVERVGERPIMHLTWWTLNDGDHFRVAEFLTQALFLTQN